MTEIDLIQKLNVNFLNYGNHELREFEIEMGKFCDEIIAFSGLKTKEKVYKLLNEFIMHFVQQGEIDKAYNGFYFMSIYTRRNLDYFIFEDLINSYQSTFADFSTYYHIISIYYLTVGIPRNKYEEFLSNGLKLYTKFNKHSGIVHCYADIVATIYESALISEDDKLLKNIEENYLSEALKAIELAILLDSNNKYAKFYSTKGRLLVINKQYEEGKLFLKKAISFEGSSKSDSISSYQNYILKADIIAFYNSYKLMKTSSEKEYNNFTSTITDQMKTNVEKIDNKLEQSTIKNIEILTFFTGLIGFLVSSISIAVSADNLKDAYSLIIVVFGSFLAAFGTMDAIIKIKNERTFIPYIANIIAVCIGIGIVLLMYFK